MLGHRVAGLVEDEEAGASGAIVNGTDKGFPCLGFRSSEEWKGNGYDCGMHVRTMRIKSTRLGKGGRHKYRRLYGAPLGFARM